MIPYILQLYAFIAYNLHMLSYLTTLLTAFVLIRIDNEYIMFTTLYFVIQVTECNILNILWKFPIGYESSNYNLIRILYFAIFIVTSISLVVSSAYGIFYIDNNFILYISCFVLIRCLLTFIGWIIGFVMAIIKPEIFVSIQKDGKQLIQFLEKYYPNNQSYVINS